MCSPSFVQVGKDKRLENSFFPGWDIKISQAKGETFLMSNSIKSVTSLLGVSSRKVGKP